MNQQPEDLKKSLINKLSRLISYPTLTYDHQVIKKALDWVEKELEGLPLYRKRIYVNQVPSLVVTTQFTQEPTCWLVAHLDVVSGNQAQFNPHVSQGKLFGRGAYDMKFAIALFLVLFQALGKALTAHNLGLMISSDEECGGQDGVGYLLSQGYRSKVALIPDGGFNWKVEAEAKGVLCIEVIASGQSAHSSRPWEGTNAIDQLICCLTAFKTFFNEQAAASPHYHTTANLANLHGGKVLNQVPALAKAHLDIRYTAGESPQELLQELKKIAARSAMGIVVNPVASSAAAHQLDLTTPYLASFQDVAQQLYAINVATTRSHGASDARYFGEHGIPALVVAPQGGGHHGPNEWIDIDDLVRFYYVVKEWCLRLP